MRLRHTVRKREVWYTLQHENDAKTTLVPVATYPRYVDALADGKLIDTPGWHHKISRHSNPFYA